MIDYKYPTIASGATPIESVGREIISRRTRKKISSPLTLNLFSSGERIQEPDDFGHCIFQIEEIED
jgi:hypothetical protein